jgi:DNA primase
MSREHLDELKHQIPLLDYLQAHDWWPAWPLSRGRWMGLCPLHEDHQPSFMVDPFKNLFYCYGCNRGGDVIRFADLPLTSAWPLSIVRCVPSSQRRPNRLPRVFRSPTGAVHPWASAARAPP